jgi:hypothetical protein
MEKSPEWQGSHFENQQPIVNDNWAAFVTMSRSDHQPGAPASTEDPSGRSRPFCVAATLGADQPALPISLGVDGARRPQRGGRGRPVGADAAGYNV